MTWYDLITNTIANDSEKHKLSANDRNSLIAFLQKEVIRRTNSDDIEQTSP